MFRAVILPCAMATGATRGASFAVIAAHESPMTNTSGCLELQVLVHHRSSDAVVRTRKPLDEFHGADSRGPRDGQRRNDFLPVDLEAIGEAARGVRTEANLDALFLEPLQRMPRQFRMHAAENFRRGLQDD